MTNIEVQKLAEEKYPVGFGYDYNVGNFTRSEIHLLQRKSFTHGYTTCQQTGDKYAILTDEIVKALDGMPDKNPDKPYLIKREKSWTRTQLITEIKSGSEEGKDIVNGMLELTIDLLHRSKKELPVKPETDVNELQKEIERLKVLLNSQKELMEKFYLEGFSQKEGGGAYHFEDYYTYLTQNK